MRTKVTVEKVMVSPFNVTSKRPYEFKGSALIMIWLVRTFKDRSEQKALLEISILPGFITDGASTFWPISKMVPNWRKGDDRYNAAPTAHDILYLLGGNVIGELEPVKLSREEADDILRGIWRCWGMSRFIAGCADKGVEIFAGGKKHWENDSYNVRKYVEVKWMELK